MRYCEQCGANLPENSAFCPSCGAMSASSAAPPPVSAPPHPEFQPDPSAQSYGTIPPAGTQPQQLPPYTASAPYPQQGAPVYTNYGAPPVKPGDPAKNWAAISGFIGGLLSYFLCCLFPPLGPILAILAIVFGIIGMKSQQRGLSIAALILGILFILLFAVLAILLAVGFSALPEVMENIPFEGLDEFQDYFQNMRALAMGSFPLVR